ncbi:3-oxoacyl-[acyl-carrier protein] reductase [Modestobacter sp. DSM 44400]|uniref:3-oxoacyl-ACP reductase n=1 Tax=Modestobacter sp. DSM 44400 TaxID=1550230 RepID=UPI00089AB7C2|nr:3-oxoacyl-ACP reductase [Modestobacter sp. DSM 44400]SDY57778.1 3-oxoacyl-[acyl-carrier protein] reductase [Modestobacter sp. DSM 44400]
MNAPAASELPDGVSGLGRSDLLAGRVAVVTGASRGIGAAIARALGAHGAAVAVNYLRNADRARQVVRDIQQLGGRAESFAADVTDAAAVADMVAAVAERFGPVDVVVNNALHSYTFDPLSRRTAWDIPWADYSAQFTGSVGGAYTVCQAAIPGMRARGNGRIITIVSDLIERPGVPYHDYTTAKAAVVGFSRNLAADLGPFGITVNCIAPGLVPGTDSSAVATDEQRDDLESATPLRRLTTPADVAGAVLFFASRWSDHVTGACLFVDGGLVMR